MSGVRRLLGFGLFGLGFGVLMGLLRRRPVPEAVGKADIGPGQA